MYTYSSYINIRLVLVYTINLPSEGWCIKLIVRHVQLKLCSKTRTIHTYRVMKPMRMCIRGPKYKDHTRVSIIFAHIYTPNRILVPCT
jgi:hypothetical protein